MKRGILFVLLVIVFISISTVFVIAENSEGTINEWRMFGRNLNHTGWDGVTYSYPQNISNAATYYTAGSYIYSNPAIVDGYVYFGSSDNKLHQVNASNVEHGIASYTTGGVVYSSPAVANGYVYVGSYDNSIYQLNASNVSQKIANLTIASGVLEDVTASPTVANGYVYIGSYDDKFYQLNASNVSQIYATYTTGGDIGSSAAIANGYIYVGSSDNKLYQLNASNVSKFYASYTAGNIISSSPSVADGYVYVGSLDNKLYQLNASNVSKIHSSITLGDVVYASPAIVDGFVYITSYDNKLYQLNASNVSQIYSYYDTGSTIFTSPVVSNGYVYFGVTSGGVYQLNASNVSQLAGYFVTGSPVRTMSIANGFAYFGDINFALYQMNASNLSWINYDLPGVSINSPSSTTYTTSNVFVNISLSERGTCNYTLGSNSYSLTADSDNRVFTGTSSSLESGTYTLIANCLDMGLNINNTQNVTFTIDIPVTENQVSSSGSSSRSYSLSTDELISGYRNSFRIGDVYVFNIDSKKHFLVFLRFNSTTTVARIQPQFKNIYFPLGEEQRIDINEDGKEDLTVTYEEYTRLSPVIYMKKITEVKEDATLTGSEIDGLKDYTSLIIILFLIIVSIVYYGYSWYHDNIINEHRHIDRNHHPYR